MSCPVTPASIRKLMPPVCDEENECFLANQLKCYESMELEARQKKWETSFTVRENEELDSMLMDSVFLRLIRWLERERFHVTIEKDRFRTFTVSWDPAYAPHNVTAEERHNPQSNAMIRLRTIERLMHSPKRNVSSPPLLKKTYSTTIPSASYQDNHAFEQQEFSKWLLQNTEKQTCLVSNQNQNVANEHAFLVPPTTTAAKERQWNSVPMVFSDEKEPAKKPSVWNHESRILRANAIAGAGSPFGVHPSMETRNDHSKLSSSNSDNDEDSNADDEKADTKSPFALS